VLRRAENIGMVHRVNLFTRRGRVQLTLGRHTYFVGPKLRKEELHEVFAQSDRRPAYVGTVKERQYWWFRGRWFWDNDGLSADDVFALLETRDRRQAASLARAQTLAYAPEQPVRYRRSAVPAEVRHFVWARDGGRCTDCGSTNEIQYDHVIPVSRGGSNEPANIQILCGPCNRRKGASVS
jgi:hypothetical protein